MVFSHALFFFFKQKTAYEMRISDWSSDVCSSDLFPMPLLMEAGRAAAIICRGLAANKARIVFPRRLYAAVWLLALLPPAWTDPLLARLPEKAAAGEPQTGA